MTLSDEDHEAYGAMVHRGRVEAAQEPEKPLPLRPGRVPAYRPMNALARQLREERLRQRRMQKEVAHTLGCERPELSKWETGIRGVWLDNFVAWADVLGFEVVLRKKGSL